jgi:hypothetical protein
MPSRSAHSLPSAQSLRELTLDFFLPLERMHDLAKAAHAGRGVERGAHDTVSGSQGEGVQPYARAASAWPCP